MPPARLQALCLALALGLLGCATDGNRAYFMNTESGANVFVAPVPSPVAKIAILPFKAPTELIGNSFADMFVTEMMRAGRYQLVERGQMAKVLGESELSISGISEAKAVEIGSLLGADGVVIGTVDEYSTIAHRGHPYPIVGSNIRMIDCRSGQVMWSVGLAKRADDKKAALAEHARVVVHEMMAGLYQEWRVQKYEPRAEAAAPAPAARIEPSAPEPEPGPPPLEPPAGFTLSDLGLREVAIRWEVPRDAREIRIERSLSREGSFYALATVRARTREYVDAGTPELPLEDAKTYYYRLVAIARDGRESAPTAVRESLTAPPPEPPAGLKAGGDGLRSVPLSWSASPEESVVRYDLFRGAGKAGSFEKIASAEGRETTSYTDEAGLQDSATYFYRISAVNSAGAASACSEVAGATTRGAPPAVLNFKAESGLPRKVALKWTASPDDAVSGYEIRRTPKGSPDATVLKVDGGSAASYTDAGLDDGAEYGYTIAAVNRVGAKSKASDATTAATKPAPRPPTGLAATTNRPGAVAVSWSPSPQPDIAAYVVEAGDAAGGDFAEIARAKGSPAEEAGLEPGRARRYRVKAVDVDGLESAWSESAGGRSKPLPDAPGSVAADYRSGSVELSWAPPPQPDVVSYKVWKKAGKEWSFAGETRGPTFSLGFADVGREAVVAVTAVDADGLESARSEFVGLTESAPPAPQGLEASSEGLREVTLRWPAPSDNSRFYRIERSGSPDGPFETVAKLAPGAGTYVDRGAREAPLGDTMKLYYRLVAIAAGERESEPGATAEAATAPPPEPPASVTATAPASRALRVTWAASTSKDVVKYLVERAAADAPDRYVKLAETAERGFSEGGTAESPLGDSTTYFYRITSVNRVGSAGRPSEPAEVTTLPVPARIQGFTAKGAEVRCVPLSWKASPEKDVVRYDLYRGESEDGEFALLASVKGRDKTSFLDGTKDPGDLEDEHTYYYRIRAVNAVTAQSEDSETIRATTRAVPPAVEGVKAKSGSPREIPVAWRESPDAKVIGYEVHRAGEGDDAFRAIATVPGRGTTTYNDRGENRRPTGLGTLGDGTEYRYQVIAFNTALAKSERSGEAAARTKPAPAAPAVLSATTNLPKAVKIAWEANPEPDIAAYAVVSSDTADGKFREVGRVSPGAEETMTYTDGEEPDGAMRYYRVKAIDRDTLESAWSETLGGVTKRLPDAPADLATEERGDGVLLTWSAPPQPDIREYRLWKKGFGGGDPLTSLPGREYLLTWQMIAKRIVVCVSAVDEDGLESERSVPVDVRAPAAP